MLSKDLETVFSMWNSEWRLQNDSADGKTRFIYGCKTFSDLTAQIGKAGLNAEETNYAYHRWYNFKTSKEAEQIFVDNGCRPADDPMDHDVDIHIYNAIAGKEIPFDVKLTVFPKYFDFNGSCINPADPASFLTRMARNELARWYYKNQSGGKRHQEAVNRLYLLGLPSWKEGCGYTFDCRTDDQSIKCDFQGIEDVVQKFLKYHKKKSFNTINLYGAPVNTDVLFIRSSKGTAGAGAAGTVPAQPAQGAQGNVA